jgi:hypothetical protein
MNRIILTTKASWSMTLLVCMGALIGTTVATAQEAPRETAPINHYRTELRPNETLSECLVRLKIVDSELYRAIEHLDVADDIQALAASTPIRLKVNAQGAVLLLKLPLQTHSPLQAEKPIQAPTKFPVLVFSRENAPSSNLQWRYVQESTKIRLVNKSAQFDGNFFNVMDRQEIPDTISEQFTRIFSSSVNFSNELRHQAHFSMTYEVADLDDSPVATGKILHALLDTSRHQHHAYWWQTQTDQAGRYYSPAGEVLSARSWKSPILYSRKTSDFGMRLDPFTGSWSNHQGVDIGAPNGTEVRATQQGRIKTAGYQGHYGNVIIIEHGKGYETTYAHLSRFANIAPLQSVRQGALIGYVGSTGRSSGPHLHYELRRYGKALDPQETFHGGDEPDHLTGVELEKFIQFQRNLNTQTPTERLLLLSKN